MCGKLSHDLARRWWLIVIGPCCPTSFFLSSPSCGYKSVGLPLQNILIACFQQRIANFHSLSRSSEGILMQLCLINECSWFEFCQCADLHWQTNWGALSLSLSPSTSSSVCVCACVRVSVCDDKEGAPIKQLPCACRDNKVVARMHISQRKWNLDDATAAIN